MVERVRRTTLAGPSSGGLRDRRWQRFLKGPDPSLLEELYVPALAEALRYDRCCSYFSSTVLAAAARGFSKLIERLEAAGEAAPCPAVRLVVNEEMTEEDVRAVVETGDTSRLEELLHRRLRSPTDLLERDRLAMLGWLVKRGLLEIRVGVMRHGVGVVHAKFGVATDGSGDAVVFSGSGNETRSGLVANYERLEISTSWEDPDRHREYVEEFDRLWDDTHADVHTVSLPEALRLKLLKLAPPEAPEVEPSNALARQRAAMVWRFIAEAPYLPGGEAACDATAMVDLWPHQRRVVQETADAWPDGRLLCDEVGMGKTIEAILALRRLLAGRGVRRALILVPAGLLKQWQAEFREKGALIVPRLEGATLVWPDDRTERVPGLATALEQDMLLMSRETARTENNLPFLLAAKPWDLVILDESHAARRKRQEEAEFNSATLLLELLRQLQLRRQARGLLLLSATPMQTHPWEPWDLLAVLGEGGAWLSEFGGVRDFYGAVAAVEKGRCDLETGRRAASLIASDERFPQMPGAPRWPQDAEEVARGLAFTPPTKRGDVAGWLRRGSPLARRMHRNTRQALRRYYELGLLPHPPPRRIVDDGAFDYEDSEERAVYDEVGQYIEKRYRELEAEKSGKGFVMTVYRRRASSSWWAIERSLQRRCDGLARLLGRRAYDLNLDRGDEPEDLDAEDLPEDGSETISSAIPQDPEVARRELAEVEALLQRVHNLRGRDTKRERFFSVLRRLTEDGRPALVFTGYTDTQQYLRDHLVDHYGKALGCYSGEGGTIWTGDSWRPVTKDAITAALRAGQLQILICTDAASEGLNLQAAGALINYDLPWTPAKVEQRIGRIDRIGQARNEIFVVNLFLRNSVDDLVYGALRRRCGLFEHFVGAMQPVLARARQMLIGREVVDPRRLDEAADVVERDPLLGESYLETDVVGDGVASAVPLQRTDVAAALELLNFGSDATVRPRANGRYHVALGGRRPARFGTGGSVLEADKALLPLSPLLPEIQNLSGSLARPGERLPLVIGTWSSGAFRASVALWVGEGDPAPVGSLDALRTRVDGWSGQYPDPARWVAAERQAQAEAARFVADLDERAARREREALGRQVDSARRRLLRELGRYLICIDSTEADLNRVLHTQMTRDIASAQRLQQALLRLGGWPEWSEDLRRALERFREDLPENQRRGRLLGRELEAALADPRWIAMETLDAMAGRHGPT